MDQKRILSDADIKGFVNLLKDSEDSIIALMAKQLSNMSSEALQVIDHMAENSNNESLVDNWYHTSRLSLKYRIEEWKKAKGENLEEGLYLVSRIKKPAFDEQRYRDKLDSYAKRVNDKLTPQSSSDDVIEAINTVLFEEEKFTGNQVNYYDINNNFIHSVLDTKLGNPIMLSSLYILVARRLGLEVQGIGAPGHFIIKFNDQLLDPFFNGRKISREECIIRAQELSVFWRDEYLDPIDDSFVVARCVRNLIAIYKRNNDLDKASDITELLKLI